jgi:CRISPR type IV-associated protein Csf3
MLTDMPFEKYEGVNGWCWKASMLQVIGKTGMSLRYITNKTPVHAMAHDMDRGIVSSKGPAVIDTVRGHAKNGQATYPLEWASGLQAWCIGDVDALQHYLGQFDGIGYKQIRGHGTLAPLDGSLVRITVDESAHDKWKQRNLPDMLLDAQACFADACALHPPYWQNRHVGWVPL